MKITKRVIKKEDCKDVKHNIFYSTDADFVEDACFHNEFEKIIK